MYHETDDLSGYEDQIDMLETEAEIQEKSEAVDALEDRVADLESVVQLCGKVLTELLAVPGEATPARLRGARCLQQIQRIMAGG